MTYRRDQVNNPEPSDEQDAADNGAVYNSNNYPNNDSKPLLTPEEFRQIGLGGAVGRNSIYELIRANRIRHVKIGRKILIPRSEVHDFPAREANLA